MHHTPIDTPNHCSAFLRGAANNHNISAHWIQCGHGVLCESSLCIAARAGRCRCASPRAREPRLRNDIDYLLQVDIQF